MIQNPSDFGGGKIGIEQQAGLAAEFRLGVGAVQFPAAIRGATVLPYDSIVNGRAAAAIPQDSGLALIGDADRGHGTALNRANAAEPGGSVDSTVAQITSASCSTQPGAG